MIIYEALPRDYIDGSPVLMISGQFAVNDPIYLRPDEYEIDREILSQRLYGVTYLASFIGSKFAPLWIERYIQTMSRFVRQDESLVFSDVTVLVKSRVKRIAVLRTDGYSCEFDSEKLKHYKPHTQGILVRQTSRLTLSGKSENTLEQDIFEFVSARYEKQRNVYAIDIINHLGIGRNILNLDTLMGAEVIPDPLRSGDSQETLALQLDHNVLIPKDIVMALSHFHII